MTDYERLKLNSTIALELIGELKQYLDIMFDDNNREIKIIKRRVNNIVKALLK